VSGLAGIAALATSSFDGGTMIAIAGIFSGINVGFTAGALGQGIYRISNIKRELPEATTNSFRRTNLNGEPYTKEYLALRSASLTDVINDYNNHLLAIQYNIMNGQRNMAIAKFDSLLVLDSLLQDAQINSLVPIYAAAPYANSVISNFDSLYNFTVINSAGHSMFKRQSVNYSLIGYLLDSTNTNIIDSINTNIAGIINANSQMVTDIENMNDSLAGISVPAHIFVTSYSVPKPMLHSTSYPVSFSYKNIGTINATDVYAKLTLPDGFTATQDSIFMGSVSVGGIGTVTFNIQTPASDTIGYLGVEFNSPNSTSDAIGTSLVVKNIVSIPDKDNLLSSEISIYPNPFTSEATIAFGEEQRNTIIQIVDILGKELKTVNFTGRSFVIEKGILKPGVYLIKITDYKKNTVNRKVIIQ
jgi:hypothetical protein